MDCNQIRDLLLTDILDGEADLSLREAVGSHLTRCSRCRDYGADLQKTLKKPFDVSSEIKPSDAVWDRIKEKTKVKSARRFYFNASQFRLPVFGLTIAGVILVVASVLVSPLMSNDKNMNLYLTEHLEFLTQLDADSSSYSESDTGAVGTVIEGYFMS